VLGGSLLGSNAYAESQAEIAARLNEEGKQLMFDGKYKEASAKFQDAHGRVPEPKYFFNHCTSLFQEGKFGEALTACNAADKNADDKLKGKIAKLVEKIREVAKEQNVDLQPVGGGSGPGTPPPDPNQPPPDPNNPNNPNPDPNPNPQPQPPATYAVGRPPAVGLFQAAPPQNKYTWSLGIDLYGGGGRVGQENAYGNAATGVRLKGDYMLNPGARFGAQGYFQLTHFGEGDGMVGATQFDSLDIFDIGIAAYKHLCGPTARLCVTPLLGIQFAMMSPADRGGDGQQLFNYGAAGLRLEAGLEYMLGSRYEHVLGFQIGGNIYSSVFAEPEQDPLDPMPQSAFYGLDRGGAALYLGLGYTYRFNTPFGSAPFVTLE
jgi:hypothetical protein